MHYFNGFKVIVRPTEQEVFILERTWKERLFSLPWKPLVKTKEYKNLLSIKRNREIQQLGDTFYVTQEQKIALISKLKGNKYD